MATVLKQSSPTAQVKPPLASEEETVTPVPHPIGLTELATSLEVLNLEAGRKTVVHRSQPGSPSAVNEISGQKGPEKNLTCPSSPA